MEVQVKYTLLIFEDEKNGWGKLSASEQQAFFGEYKTFTEEIRKAGKYVAGQQLQPTSAATSVRVRDGKRLVTDGPFAETREQLGGFYILDAENLDEAIALASRIPSARLGTIEIRPVVETAPSREG
jgi:hypothetical protein